MKKLPHGLAIAAIFFANIATAQFSVTIQNSSSTASGDAVLYKLSGAKDIVVQKQTLSNGNWKFQIKEPYFGMMKVYFPAENISFRFISENKDVTIATEIADKKLSKIVYRDEVNQLMDKVQDVEKKKEYVLPALMQMTDFYKADTAFGTALRTEIAALQNPHYKIDAEKNPFIAYFVSNSQKYLGEDAKKVSNSDIATFLANTNQYLETSSLLRPLLLQYLNNSPKSNLNESIDQLLEKVNLESGRGQVILAELLDIFDAYGLEPQKEKYLNQAQNLKCKIVDRLATTLQANKNTAIGAVFPNYTFQNAVHTSQKSIYDIKADKKVIVFWSSTCSHCEADLPVLMTKYADLKAKNVEIIGLSSDTEMSAYKEKASVYPWISSSELRGWNSSFVELYSVFATPTYYILDKNNVIIAKPNRAQDVLNFLGAK